MTNQEILEIAMKQSAEDIGCDAADFLSEKPIIKPVHLGAHARAYFREPISCDFHSYGNNVVVATTDELSDIVSAFTEKFDFYHLFETPNLHWLNERLAERGHKICFMAEYFLPDVDRIPELHCLYPTKLLTRQALSELPQPKWSNALCGEQHDVLGVGAYDQGALVGLAACTADCENMWQIGVDVLPEYRRQGIASALTSALAKEILARDKVPFYCSAWSNLRSVKNTIKSGFRPAWVEMTAKPTHIVDEMNQ